MYIILICSYSVNEVGNVFNTYCNYNINEVGNVFKRSTIRILNLLQNYSC